MEIRKILKKVFLTFQTLIVMSFLNIPVLAANDPDISAVTDGIDILIDLVMAVIGGVGVIFLAWGLMDFGTAYSQHDGSQQMQGIKKAVAGVIIIAVPTLVTLFK